MYQLHGLEQRSYKEISKRLGIPVATVGSRLTGPRVKLNALLQERVAQAV